MDARNSYTGIGGNTGDGDSQSPGNQFRPVPETKEQVQAKTIEVIDKVQEKTGQAVEQVQQQAQSALTQQKEQASEGLNSVAGALRQTGQSLREQGQQEQIAQFADRAADQVERFSTYLRDKELGDITHEVERFARREPAIFLGGAIALGLLGARFLRSSSQRAQQMQNYSGASFQGSTYSGGYSPPQGRSHGHGSSYSGSGAYSAGYGYGTSGYSGTGVDSDYETGTGLGSATGYQTQTPSDLGADTSMDMGTGTPSGYRAATETGIEAGYPSTSIDTGRSYETGVIYTQEPYMGPSERQRRKDSQEQSEQEG